VNEIIKLPEIRQPSNLEEAKSMIIQLGRNMGEHAYIIGKILIWVKAQLKHGEFLNYIEENVWFSRMTAHRFMIFTLECDEAHCLLDKPHYLEKEKCNKLLHLESLDDRSIVPYDENIYYLSNKFQQDRTGDFVMIGKNDTCPTLKRRSWFFHKETGAEFTLREYARVQTFPDTFKFVGTYETIKDQIGNAVAPQMAEYIGKELSGKTFGDLFAGCGGLSWGLEKLGKKAIWAIDNNSKYARTYQVNHPNALVVISNIEKLDPKNFKKVDIIVGGPPCQGFSLSGLRFKNDPRNELYKEFLRFVGALEPAEFLMENVMQIKNFAGQITRDFERIGYKMETKAVKGLEIGMRQRRNRFFFTGRKTG